MLALLSSMPFESDKILESITNVRTLKIANKTIYKGKLSGRDLLLLNTGIGKVNAAHSATGIIENFPIKNIINLGVGGAYPGSGLSIGDIAIATKEIYGDEGVITSKGLDSLKKIGIPLVQTGEKKYFNEFPLDKIFDKGVNKGILLQGNREGFKIKSGSFLTVSATTGTHKRAKELERRFNSICENMEGAAISQVCLLYNITVMEIRSISNMVGVRDKRKWNVKLASENCQEAVLNLIKIISCR